MERSYKKNFLSILVFTLAICVAFAIASLTPKSLAKAEVNGFAVSSEVTFETDVNGGNLKFNVEVGEDWLLANSSEKYTFGALIYPTANGNYDNSKTLQENENALDSVNVVARNNDLVNQSLVYTVSLKIDFERIGKWATSVKPELLNDVDALNTAIETVFQKLSAMKFTVVGYAITDSGVITTGEFSTSINEVMEDDEGGESGGVTEQTYSFKLTSLTYGGRKYSVGDSIYGILITENFATLTIAPNNVATLVSNSGTSNGSWKTVGGDMVLTLTDNRDTYTTAVEYDSENNVINFKVSVFGYEFAVPTGVNYEDVIGNPVATVSYTFDYMYYDDGDGDMSNNNIFSVGDETPYWGVLTEESAVLKIFKDNTFRLTLPSGSLYSGSIVIDGDNVLLVDISLDEDELDSAIILTQGDQEGIVNVNDSGFIYVLSVPAQ